MGTIVKLNAPFRQRTKPARQAAMVDRFALFRRDAEDVFWLKENAEVLNVLECTGTRLDARALSVHGEFYEDIERRMGFFPQYYRFFLSICLDLEDLGVPGRKGARLADWVASQGLAEAELSDLQRAEARRLCHRRGMEAMQGDTGLDDRLRRFARRSETFAMPNKKAAYELTHIVFYLSEYGRRDPILDGQIIESLRFAGTLAFLELNTDLLSEICIALRFAGHKAPDIWESWLCDQAQRFVIEEVGEGPAMDDYHPYLMVNWFMSIAGLGGFGQELPEGAVRFVQPKPSVGPLRELSECMYRMDGCRSTDWGAMREAVGEGLSDEARMVLTAAEQAVNFGAFFEGFSRAKLQGVHA